jgi:nucleoside-diphosphate-sugar epimerase
MMEAASVRRVLVTGATGMLGRHVVDRREQRPATSLRSRRERPLEEPASRILVEHHRPDFKTCSRAASAQDGMDA